MEQVRSKRVETHELRGYFLEVENNFGNSIRVLIEEKESEKTFVADLPFDALPSEVKVLFPSIDDLYDHIQQCIERQLDLLKIVPNGSLQVSEVFKKRVRNVIIPTVQRDEAPLERLSRRNDQLFKTINQLREEVRHQKQQLLDKIDQISEKGEERADRLRLEITRYVNEEKALNQNFKVELSEQLRRVKEQVLNQVELSKRESLGSTQSILDGIKKEWQNKLIESERKCSAAIEKTKIDCERVQREQQKRLDRVNEEIRKCSVAMASKESLQAMRQNFGKFSSKAEANENRQVALQDKQDSIQRELQKHLTILQSYLPLIDAKRVSFVVDTSLEAFKKHWKIDEASKIIEKTTSASWFQTPGQVVSKNELPKTGKYYFEVRCIDKQSPSFGIVTNSSRDKENAESEQDQFIRLYYDGSIYQNGKQLQKVKCTINNGDLVSIFVDKQKAQIRWFVNHHSIASAKLAECFQTKPIYALLGQGNAGTKYQCIE